MAYPYGFKDVVKMNEKKERLEDVKNRACAAIAYAVARSCEIRASQRSAFLSDLDALFARVESAETLADMLRPIPFFLSKYDEYGGDIASKKIEEFFKKTEKPVDKRKNRNTI